MIRRKKTASVIPAEAVPVISAKSMSGMRSKSFRKGRYIKKYVRANFVCDACHQSGKPSPNHQIRCTRAGHQAQLCICFGGCPCNVSTVRKCNAHCRQEKDWCYQGVQVGRATLGNWVLKFTKENLFPLYERMKEELLKGGVIAADETEIQVLKEKDRLPSAKSKMWVLPKCQSEHRYGRPAADHTFRVSARKVR